MEFRKVFVNTLYDNVKGTTPFCAKKVAVLNCWGKMRAWGCHMVHHAQSGANQRGCHD